MNDDADMRRRPVAEQWLVARTLGEGAPTTRRRLAGALGCNERAVYERASLEGWRTPDFRRPAVRAAYQNFIDVAYGDAEWGEGAAAGGADDAASGEPFDPDWADRDDVVERAVRAVARPAGGGRTPGPVQEGDEGEDPDAMLARGARFFSRRLSRLMRLAENGGAISKQEVEALIGFMRMMDRWETLARERARKEQAKSDEDLADALRIIDRRIVELAHDEAVRLVAERLGAG